MNKLSLLLVMFCFGIACCEASAQDRTSTNSLSTLEQGIVTQFNRVRSDPPAYANWIQGNMRSLPYAPRNLDESVVREAIRVLKSTKPLPALTVSAGISRAAMVHVKDQISKGKFSHTGSDGSNPLERMRRYGTLRGGGYENAIFLGRDSAEGMVLGWIIDAFNSDRGHRKAILNPDIYFTGVACGTQPSSGKAAGSILCVADFAKSYQDKP